MMTTKEMAKKTMGAALSTTMWAGKAATFGVGLAVVLALTVGLASTALAGTGVGARFQLGQTNTVNAITKLVGSVVGPSLQIDNNSADANATALDLQVEAGKAPMKVNSDAKVANLNSDKLDGQDSSAFVRSAYTNSETNDGGGVPAPLNNVGCDQGDFVLSGGYSAVDSGTEITGSRPFSDPTGWQVSWRNDATADTIQVWVVCADVGTPHQ